MAVQNKFNIKVNHKEKEPNNRKFEIYRINCQDCNKVHIRQIKRNTEIRLKERLENIRLYQIGKSALAAHVCNMGHNNQNEAKSLKHIIPRTFGKSCLLTPLVVSSLTCQRSHSGHLNLYANQLFSKLHNCSVFSQNLINYKLFYKKLYTIHIYKTQSY